MTPSTPRPPAIDRDLSARRRWPAGLPRPLVGPVGVGPRRQAVSADAARGSGAHALSADRALRRRDPARASRPQLRALRLRLRAGGRGRRAARPADGLVPLARRHRHAGVRRPALHRADRLGAVRGAVVRHRHRRPDHDHLLGRLSAVPDQCLPRRAVRRPHVYRGGADAGHGQSAHDPAGAAAGVVSLDRRRPARSAPGSAGSRSSVRS